MNYFKPVPIDNLLSIQRQVMDMIPFSKILEVEGVALLADYKLGVNFLTMPHLRDNLEKLNLLDSVTYIQLSVFKPNNATVIHIDPDPTSHILSLNIPISGCDGTYTNFYSSNKPPVIKHGPHVDFYYYTAEQSVLEAKIEMNRAYVITTQEPHGVEHNGNEIRLNLLVRLKPNITFDHFDSIT